MRLADIADQIAPHLNRDAAWLHGTLRNPTMKAHLGGTPGPTAKSPTEYDHADMVRAFVLLVAQLSDVNGADLAKVAAALEVRRAALQDAPGGLVPRALDEMIASIRAGSRNWHLAVRYVLNVEGQREMIIELSRFDMVVQGRRAANAERFTRGDVTLSYQFLPLGDLLSPLLAQEA
ncbi:hypothetical protein GL279_14260 [Paracoccus limosus]|uniref:Uncharacterized protein n=1 Tax=Paracoccus limosus TaxID=913252 RepID=A0A844H4H3_9RHOB|nr:hypothetical protein [Paracoccus limosus]MTH35766.1 hypothetical protein [Paracoccus limosus]